PELLPLMDIGQDEVHAGLHDTEWPRRQYGALIIEAGHQDIDALAGGAEDVLLGNLAIFEDKLAGLAAAHAELVELLGDAEAFEVLLDQKCGDALVAGFGIGLGIDDENIGARSVGDPEFGSIEDIAVALL